MTESAQRKAEFLSIWETFVADRGESHDVLTTIRAQADVSSPEPDDEQPCSAEVPGLDEDLSVAETVPLPLSSLDERTFDFGTLPELVVRSVDDPPAGPVNLEIQQMLGEGGMGTVELAVQRSLRRHVAVKRPRPGRATRIALVREALFQGVLEHPNIVPVHELGRDASDLPMLVMKRVEGTVWRDQLVRRTTATDVTELDQHLAILADVCNAVSFAHSRGIVHRDIKPENVMLGEFGEIYLLDWGLSLRLAAKRDDATAVVGTPGYLAPEMLRGERDVDEQTDVYLLGATLHEILTGRPRHDNENLYATMMAAHLSAPPAYSAEVPTPLAELATRATAADKAKRPPSARAFREELENYRLRRTSIEATNSATRALSLLRIAIEEGSDQGEIGSLFGQSRFGFSQALQIWPGNEEATDGLQSALELMIEHELARDNPLGAQALLVDLPRPRADLAAKVSSARDALSDAQKQLEAIHRDLDVGVSRRVRATLTGILAVGCCVAVEASSILLELGVLDDTHTVALVVEAMSLSLVAGAVFVFRRWTFANKVNAQLSWSAISLIALLLLNRIAAALLEVSDAAAAVTDLVVCSAWGLMLGLAVDRRGLPLVLLWAGFTLVAAALPRYAIHIEPIAMLVTIGAMAVIWMIPEKSARTRES